MKQTMGSHSLQSLNIGVAWITRYSFTIHRLSFFPSRVAVAYGEEPTATATAYFW